MIDWLKNLDIATLLLGAVLGAILGAVVNTWYDHYVRRPRLQVTGSGSGGGTGNFRTNRLTISNHFNLLGLNLEPTTIFGKSLHRHINMWLPVEREPARQCFAFLHDKQTDELLKHLWWRASDGKLVPQVTINCRDSAVLMVFARLGDEKGRYFIYEPQIDNSGSAELKVPADHQKFDTTKKFYIMIQYTDVKRLRIDCEMKKMFDGTLQFSYPGGAHTF